MTVETDIPVKYTKCLTSVTTYNTGLSDWDNLDELYRDKILRDKVVCKMDITYMFRKYFSEKTILEYRDVLMLIAKGLILDGQVLSDCMNDFMKIDDKFRLRIHDIFNSCPEESSFGNHIVNTFANVVINGEDSYRLFFKKKPEFVICVSNGFMYFSVEDTLRVPTLIDKVDCEVLSYAKNWRREFKFFKE